MDELVKGRAMSHNVDTREKHGELGSKKAHGMSRFNAGRCGDSREILVDGMHEASQREKADFPPILQDLRGYQHNESASVCVDCVGCSVPETRPSEPVWERDGRLDRKVF